MTERTCSVCERKHYALGLCRAHYRRVYDGNGLDPDRPLRKLPTAAERADVQTRIREQCREVESGCIEWTGWLNENGYGAIGWQGKKWLVHRAMWTVQRGELPPWPQVIDHLCRNRACVNVDHMEVVHQEVNAERGGGRHVADEVRRARYVASDTCPHGHSRKEYRHVTPRGFTYCRACRAARHLASKAARASAGST